MAQPGACRLDGLRAVVTGASSGIGAAIAEAFGAAGATVLLTHRDSEAEASAVAERIGGALVGQADLRTRGACEALVAQARERLGGLDVWVNNAGADVLTGEEVSWDWEHKLDLLLALDLKGTVACS
jgi:3-oxoacyl-[acyl-carrier protein] reductase